MPTGWNGKYIRLASDYKLSRLGLSEQTGRRPIRICDEHAGNRENPFELDKQLMKRGYFKLI